MKRIKMAAIAAAVTILLSGAALAQNRDKDDHYRANKDRQHEYKRDHDRDKDRNRDRNNSQWRRDHDRAWRNRNANTSGWHGGNSPYSRYPNGAYGYPTGAYGYPNGAYGYPNGGYRNYPGTYGRGGGYANNAGYNQGYQDGARVGQSDMAQGKPYNPYPRGVYRTSDHGYHSGYGDKGAYQQAYLSGYEAGYRSANRGGFGGYGRRY
jgi:hypothetical protein